MSWKASYALHRTTALFLRALSLLLLIEAFRRVGHADPVSAIGAGIGGITSLVGGLLGSHAANKAADQQNTAARTVADLIKQSVGQGQQAVGSATDTANQGIEYGTNTANARLGDIFNLQGDVFTDQTSRLFPYLGAGEQGVNSLAQAFAPGGSLTKQFTAPTAAEVEQTPGYQFTLNQGLQALQRSAAAGGSLQGGGTLKAITQYAQGLASTQYQKAYENAQNTFQLNRNNSFQGLMSLAGLGQTGINQAQAANQTFSNAAQNYGSQFAGNTMQGALARGSNSLQGATFGANLGLQGNEAAGNALIGGANAQAAGTVGSANAWNGALGGIANAGQFLGLSSLLKPRSYGIDGSMPPGYSQPSVAGMVPNY